MIVNLDFDDEYQKEDEVKDRIEHLDSHLKQIFPKSQYEIKTKGYYVDLKNVQRKIAADVIKQLPESNFIPEINCDECLDRPVFVFENIDLSTSSYNDYKALIDSGKHFSVPEKDLYNLKFSDLTFSIHSFLIKDEAEINDYIKTEI